MAKKTMMKKQVRKRERNKTKEEYKEKDIVKSFLKNLLGVGLFIGVVYASVLGLKSIGVFDEGYTKPESKATEISYTDIPIGTVFNRSDETYYVLFDTFKDNTHDLYVQTLSSNLNYPIYKVDMGNDYNKKYSFEESNTSPKGVKDLKINGITLIKINNGKVAKYITGNDEIASYMKENTK